MGCKAVLRDDPIILLGSCRIDACDGFGRDRILGGGSFLGHGLFLLSLLGGLVFRPRSRLFGMGTGLQEGKVGKNGSCPSMLCPIRTLA